MGSRSGRSEPCPICGALGCIAPAEREIRWGPAIHVHSAEILARAFAQITTQRAEDLKRRQDNRVLRFRRRGDR
jgi:hypothetical protein